MACEFSRGGGSEASMGGQRLYFGQISCSVGMASHGIFSTSNSMIAAQLVHHNYGAGLYSFISFRTTLREERSAEPICYIVANGISWRDDERRQVLARRGVSPWARMGGCRLTPCLSHVFAAEDRTSVIWDSWVLNWSKFLDTDRNGILSNVRLSQTGFLMESDIW